MDTSRRKILRAVVLELRRVLEADGHALPAMAWEWAFDLLALRCLEARGVPGAHWPPRFEDRQLPEALRQRAAVLIPADPKLFQPAEALGWAYQAWNSGDKDRVFETVRTRKGAKIAGRDIIAATQLYTEPYMVRFLMQNALGMLWREMHPNTRLATSWEYHALDRRTDFQSVRLGRTDWKSVLRPVAEITFLDPACGAGHFLTEAFALFYRMYEDEGITTDPAAICTAIFDNNLFGIDIDERAVRIARFALWLKAVEKAPGFRGVPAHVTALDLGDAQELGVLLRDKETVTLPLLSRQYDVVATNPPYLGTKYMGGVLKDYLTRHYPHTRADLFAAFLERCFELTRPGGMTATVTMKSWLYQAAFTRFRIACLREHTLTTFADLGSRAFDAELGLHHGVSVILTCFRKCAPAANHQSVGFRILEGKGPEAKAERLRAAQRAAPFTFRQTAILDIPETPLCYWLPARLLDALTAGPTLAGKVKQGLATTDNRRFLRFAWEVPPGDPLRRWFPCARGGTYKKWAGLDYVRVNWQVDGIAIKTLIPRKYPYLSGWEWVAKNADHYFRPGLTYSYMCYGSLSARLLRDALFEVASIGVFPEPEDAHVVLAVLNTRTTSWILRALSQKHMFQAGMTERLPLPVLPAESRRALDALVDLCVYLKRRLLRWDLLEGAFDVQSFQPSAVTLTGFLHSAQDEYHKTAAWLHTAEGEIERLVCDGYGLTAEDLRQVTDETGTPAGWFELVRGADELAALRCRLRDLYSNGPNGADARTGTPIPTETHVEELAQRLRLHPLSVASLLRDGMRHEGWRCLAEEQRLLTDYLTVTVLNVFGHSWPGRSPWRAGDAIVPLTEGTGRPTLLDRVRAQLAADFPHGSPSALEQEFADLLGLSLERWLLTRFFRLHVQRFKRRPLLWQLQSGRRRPVFACLVYYPRLNGATLPRIRQEYVAPLCKRLEGRGEELRRFDAALRQSEDEGFFTPTLPSLLAEEPLDRWCAPDDCIAAPPDRAQLLRQESAYHPDLNDGVRVNLAPLQKAGVLAVDVLAKRDLEPALADRAAWRADERGWCREGKLPRPGWWPAP